jgi:hypothetical protein
VSRQRRNEAVKGERRFVSTRIASLLVTIAPRTEIAEPSTSDLFAHEWAKFRRRPVLTWCLVIIAVVAIGFTDGRAAIILGRDRWDNDIVVTADTWDFLALPNLIETASLILSMIGSLLTVVLGAAVVTSDY